MHPVIHSATPAKTTQTVLHAYLVTSSITTIATQIVSHAIPTTTPIMGSASSVRHNAQPATPPPPTPAPHVPTRNIITTPPPSPAPLAVLLPITLIACSNAFSAHLHAPLATSYTILALPASMDSSLLGEGVSYHALLSITTLMGPVQLAGHIV